MIDIIELARKYKLVIIPLENGWFVGRMDRDGYPGCYFDHRMGIIDGHLEPYSIAETLPGAVALCIKRIEEANHA